jgi:ligand-binding sensor domain-containing protein
MRQPPLTRFLQYSMLIILPAWLAVSCEDQDAKDALDPSSLDRWVSYNSLNGLGDNFIWDIYEDDQENIWAGTGGAGVRRYDGQRWTAYTTDDGMLSNSVYAVAQDSDGYMWFGTGGGLNFLIGGEVYYNESFVDIPITALFEDSHRRMWVGTYGYGIYVYYNGSFYSTYFTDSADYNYINSITEASSGLIWFGTEGAAIDFNGNDFFIVDSRNGLNSRDITHIQEDSWGQLWFCSFYSKFISRYDGKNFEEIYLYHGYNIAGAFSIMEDLNHDLWFVSAAGGIIRYNGIEMIPVKTPAGYEDESFNCSAMDQNGNLWFGGLKHGILVYINK